MKALSPQQTKNTETNIIQRDKSQKKFIIKLRNIHSLDYLYIAYMRMITNLPLCGLYMEKKMV